MRVRANGELCFAYQEFQELKASAVCRRLNIGESWVDDEANEAARAAQEQDQRQAARTGS